MLCLKTVKKKILLDLKFYRIVIFSCVKRESKGFLIFWARTTHLSNYTTETKYLLTNNLEIIMWKCITNILYFGPLISEVHEMATDIFSLK